MGGLFGGGGSTTTTTNVAAPPSAEELELIRVNTELGKKQLANIDALAPFQSQLLELSMADLQKQSTISQAIDAAVTPEQQAQAVKDEFERSQRLGPVQDELLQLQLDALRRGG